MNRLLIVDGSNLLFQMFFGMPARIVNQEGKAIQGTLGFVGALLKIIRMVEPTHMVVFFDGQHKNERCDLNHEYKANRIDYSLVSQDENPFSQMADVCRALDFLGIKYAETNNCEADDVIAGYTFSLNEQWEIVISSFDSDFFQLITDRVSVLRYRGEKTVICTPEYIMDKFGITPVQYADFKSLTGDKADNIRGAEKIGVKTAAALLNEFNTLENIISNTEQISKPTVRDSIVRNVERLRINYKMIKLSDTAELPFTMPELEYTYTGITTNEVLIGIGLK
ncbi:MAG: 5'-3' exonuclease H3TH domain-containing protein [Eubacterium sp.]